MKKTLFLFLLIVAVSQLKAQSLQIQPFNRFQIKPFSKLPDDLYKKYLDTNANSFKLTKPYQQFLVDSQKNNQSSTLYAYDRMPIIKPKGYWKMPVVKMEGYSNMPIIRTYNINGDTRLTIEPKQ